MTTRELMESIKENGTYALQWRSDMWWCERIWRMVDGMIWDMDGTRGQTPIEEFLRFPDTIWRRMLVIPLPEFEAARQEDEDSYTRRTQTHENHTETTRRNP